MSSVMTRFTERIPRKSKEKKVAGRRARSSWRRWATGPAASAG